MDAACDAACLVVPRFTLLTVCSLSFPHVVCLDARLLDFAIMRFVPSCDCVSVMTFADVPPVGGLVSSCILRDLHVVDLGLVTRCARQCAARPHPGSEVCFVEPS